MMCYGLCQYNFSVLHNTSYNMLLYGYNFNPIKNTQLRHMTVHYFSRIVQPEAVLDVQYVFFFALYIM
jgi:hypothetical protein